MEMIADSHLKDFGLKLEDVKAVALRNLKNKLNQNCKIGTMDLSAMNPQIKPFFKVEMDANYNPSIMLIDEFWEQAAKPAAKTDLIAVSIPAKNLLFFSDLKLREATTIWNSI